MKVSNPQLRYAVYVRKSSDSEDRQMQSIGDQLEGIKHIVLDNDIKVVKYFEETRTAKRPGRPMFNEMMEMLSQGKIDGIICWAINRLSRNPIDGGNIQWFLQEEIIKSIVTTSNEHFPTDNVVMLSVELGIANQYSLELGRNVKRGMNSKVRKGYKPSKAPIGYLNDPMGLKGDKKVFVDDERFPIVRKMWDLLLTGNYTVKQIRDISANEWGLKRKQTTKRPGLALGLSGVYKLFTNPFYYGGFEYKGELNEGNQQPMISKQ